MSRAESAAPAWRKSSRCDSSACVEVAWRDPGMAVRDNTRPDVQLHFDGASWQGLVRDLRGGRFDRRPRRA